MGGVGLADTQHAVAGLADHPVTAVSWTDAVSYARWLESELRESEETPAELRAKFSISDADVQELAFFYIGRPAGDRRPGASP